MDPGNAPPSRARALIARGYALVEDVAYVGLGVLLAITTVTLLGFTFVELAKDIFHRSLSGGGVIELLDQILLILLIVELLYTVQVSFREHALVAAPFLLVGLISAIRRILVVTAQLGEAKGQVPPWAVAELAVLGLLVVTLAVSLMLLQKSGTATHRG